MHVRLFLITILCVGWVATALCENRSLKYEHFGVENGLPSQTIYAAHEDKQGFLWIATDAGVSRYDGYSFTNFSAEDGLGDNEIVEFAEDSKGRIWFFPFSGSLSYWYKGQFYNHRNTPFLSQLNTASSLTDMVEDAKGNLYFTCRLRLTTVIVLNTKNEVKEYTIDSFPDGRYIDYLFVDNKGEVFQRWNDGTIYNMKTAQRKKITPCEDCPPIIGYYQASPNINFAFDAQGLKRLNGFEATLIIPKNRLPVFKGLVRVVQDAFGNIWISHAANNTLIFFKDKEGFHDPINVLDNLTAKVCFDKKNNAWLCSPVGGMYKIPAYMLNYEILTLNQKLHSENILSTYLDSDGSYWLGYNDGKVDHVKGYQVELHDLGFGSRTYNRVLDITKNGKQQLYATLDEGGMRLFPNGLKQLLSNPYVSLNRVCKAMTRDVKGHVIFVYSDHVDAFDDDLIPEYKRLQNYIDESKRHFSIHLDSLYQAYDSRSDGLIVIGKDSLINLALKDQRLKSRVNYFHPMPDGNLLLATYGEGLISLKGQKVVDVINHRNGLAGILCRRIYAHHDTLFVSTNGGISVIRYFRGKLIWLRNITQADGLLSDDVNSIFIKDDNLYAGCSKGFSILPLHNVPKNTMPPGITLLSFHVNGKTQALNKPIRVSPGANHFQIFYVAPNLTPEHQITYRYKIKGQQQHWSETQSTSVDLSNLPSDEYQFEIQARYPYSTWSESALIRFCIDKPFYQTWWFILLSVAAVTMLTFFLVRSITRRKYRKKFEELRLLHAVEKERDRIAADIHDDIGAELTNIVLLSQQGRSNADTANVLQKLETSADTLMNKMNEVIWSLNHKNDTLSNLLLYIADYIKQFEDNCGIQVDMSVEPESIPEIPVSAQLRRNVFLVVKEALLNVYKYAGVKEAKVYFAMQDRSLFLQISDQGRGFEMNKMNLNGNGIKNMEKRIHALEGTIQFVSTPGIGTIITINMKL